MTAAPTDRIDRHLLCFGLGYTARALAGRLADSGWRITGTSRNSEEPDCHRFERDHPLAPADFAGVTHILVSIPPDEAGDPVLARHADDIAALPGLAWLGYLSTTGVYGDRAGGWVDEGSELRPGSARARRRVAAEAGWLDLWHRRGVPVHVFRLAGIYGPGRSPFAALRAGTAKRIAKPGQVFSRIHVEDLASVLIASITGPRPGAVYNVCDDEPAAPAEVVGHAASAAWSAAAAPGAVCRSRDVADGAQLLGRQQARLERADQSGVRYRAPLSELPRGVGGNPCGRHLIADIVCSPSSSTRSREEVTWPLTTY